MPLHQFTLEIVTEDQSQRRRETVELDLPFTFDRFFSLDEFKQVETQLVQNHVPENFTMDQLWLVEANGDFDVLAEREMRFGFETELYD